MTNIVSICLNVADQVWSSRILGYSTRRIHCFVNLGASLSNVFEAHPFPELNNLDVTVNVVNKLIDRSLKGDLHDEFGKFHFGWQHCKERYPTRSGEVSHAAQGTTLGQANNQGLPQQACQHPSLYYFRNLSFQLNAEKSQRCCFFH